MELSQATAKFLKEIYTGPKDSRGFSKISLGEVVPQISASYHDVISDFKKEIIDHLLDEKFLVPDIKILVHESCFFEPSDFLLGKLFRFYKNDPSKAINLAKAADMKHMHNLFSSDGATFAQFVQLVHEDIEGWSEDLYLEYDLFGSVMIKCKFTASGKRWIQENWKQIERVSNYEGLPPFEPYDPFSHEILFDSASGVISVKHVDFSLPLNKGDKEYEIFTILWKSKDSWIPYDDINDILPDDCRYSVKRMRADIKKRVVAINKKFEKSRELKGPIEWNSEGVRLSTVSTFL